MRGCDAAGPGWGGALLFEHFRGHTQHLLVEPAERLIAAVLGDQVVEFVCQSVGVSPERVPITVGSYSTREAMLCVRRAASRAHTAPQESPMTDTPPPNRFTTAATS